MKWEFDPRTGMYGPAPKRPEDDIHLMSQSPARSCWIKLLQNRVSLTSVGNTRFAKVMWFDFVKKTVSEERNGENAELFRTYMLPGAGRPAGWIYVKQKYESLANNISRRVKKALNEMAMYNTDEVEEGDLIRIIRMDDSNGTDKHATLMNGRQGIVEFIDDMGQLHGTWGSLAVIPEADEFEIIKKHAE